MNKIFLIPVFGLPASGKSTIIKRLARELILLKKNSVEEKKFEIAIIELDDFLPLLQQQQRDGDPITTNAATLEFDISKWFEARETFQKRIEDELSKSSAAITKIIFAVDNLPLKSMRNHIRNLAMKKQQQQSPSHYCYYYYLPIGFRVCLETALQRNASRSVHQRIPKEIIQQMSAKIEFDAKTDFILEEDPEEENLVKKLLGLFCLEQEEQEQQNPTKSLFLNLTVIAEQRREDHQKDSDEEFHKASRTVAHKFDLLRRQSNAALIQQLLKSEEKRSNNNNNNNDVKDVSKMLSSKKVVEVDKKILENLMKEFSLSSSTQGFGDHYGNALEEQMLSEASVRLQTVRDALLLVDVVRKRNVAAKEDDNDEK